MTDAVPAISRMPPLFPARGAAGPRLLGVGGAHIDRRGRIAGPFVPGASNPGTMREEAGGGTLNALRTAVRRGARGALFSVRGGDAAGETVARAIVDAGLVDLSAVFLDRTTPSYTALLSTDGEVIAALADMTLYEIGFPRQMRRAKLRDAVREADAVMLDANLPAAALDALAGLAENKPLFAIAISPAKAVRLARVLPRLECLFMNRREAFALVGAPDLPPRELGAALRRAGLRSAVVSDGGGPLLGFDEAGSFTLAPPAPPRIVDVSGAGDALAGAAAAALASGLSLAEAVRHGAAAAMLTVASARAVAEPSPAEFAAALAAVPAVLPLHP